MELKNIKQVKQARKKFLKSFKVSDLENPITLESIQQKLSHYDMVIRSFLRYEANQKGASSESLEKLGELLNRP